MAAAGGDPFYNRKQVPNEFIEHVGYTGMSSAQEFENRERKFSVGGTGGDLRKFSNPKYGGKLDPFYQRKQVPDSMIHGVGETGLSKEEEFLNRERKYSVNGADVRKFSDSTKGGWHPTDDPYYGRKPVAKPQIDGIGETQMSKAEELESRENKASLFDLSSDPFQQLTGSGHRASISAAAGPAAAAAAGAARRRSSAVAPDTYHTEEHAGHNHSGYAGGDKLDVIPSRAEEDEIRPSTEGYNTTTGPSTTTTTTTTTTTNIHSGSHNNPASDVAVRDETGHAVGSTGHTTFYDAATKDLDNIGPHDRV